MRKFTEKTGMEKFTWGDLGDGYYRNPILPADYSDPDIIRVGKDYFLITSTFVFSPGITVLHSVDLVNWEIIGAAVSDLTQISQNYKWDVMRGYARGIWAPCMTYHPGMKRFYIHFGDPDYGMFMTYTDDIFSGKWSNLHEVIKPDGTGFGAGWDDCGVLWEENGSGYFVVNHFADGYKNHIYQLESDGYTLKGKAVVFHQSDDHMYKDVEMWPEALKLFKKDGYYYIYHNGVVNGLRKAFLLRAKGIYGEHNSGEVGTQDNPGSYEHIPYPITEGEREPNQGNLIDVITQSGEVCWFFLTHHGALNSDGRPVSLIPVTWNQDGWPIAKEPDTLQGDDMFFKKIKMPLIADGKKHPQTSDDFDGEQLGLQWMWNYQPRNECWSLTDRKGFLRLKAFRPIRKDCLASVGNFLVQRMYRAEGNAAEMKIDFSKMQDGQFAGLLCLAGSEIGGIGVLQQEGIRYISYQDTEKYLGEKIPEEVHEIFLKAEWGRQMLVTFSYSMDQKTYTPFGKSYQIKGADYKGGHIGCCTYNETMDSGYVDIDYFRYQIDRTCEH